MNEKVLVIKEIERLMAPILSNDQLGKLHSVLDHCLLDAGDFPLRNTQFSTNSETIDAFLSAKSVEGCSIRTIRYYSQALERFSRAIGKSFIEVTTDDVRGYLTACQKSGRVSNVTVDNIRRIISSFFSWLEIEDIVYKSPVRRIKKIRSLRAVKPIITDESMEALRDGCKTARDLAIVDLLTSTGMRVGELVKLNRWDIDLTNRECVVKGKGNKERKVYFDARAKIHLSAYLEQRIDENDALFVSLNYPYKRLEISGVETRLRELGRSAIGERVHPHKFRRTLATKAIDKGMPIEQVQVLLGHSKIETTLCYAMVDQQNVKRSHHKYIG